MIACILLPYFATAIELRDQPSLSQNPLIVTEPTQKGQIWAICRLAAEAGVQPSMSLRQAQLLCSTAQLIVADHARYLAVLDQLAVILADFADQVELDQIRQAAVGWLDLGGLDRTGATQMAQQMGRAVRQALGLSPAIGLATGKFPAYIAARTTEPDKALFIAPDHEAAFLAPFAVEVLPLEAEVSRRLKLLGLRTLGQLAALPLAAVMTQFGQQGRLLHQLARGQDERPVVARPAQPIEQVTYQFDQAVADRLVLVSLLRTMAENLAACLQDQGRLTRQLQLQLQLEQQRSVTRCLVLRQPTANAGRLGQILIDLLDQLQIQVGVLEVTVTVTDLVTAAGEQLDLFDHRTRQADRLQPALQNLVARYGSDCFYQVSLLNQAERLPERRFRLWGVDAV